jgi:hypothetical protein
MRLAAQISSGDRVRDSRGKHFTVVPAAEYLSLEAAQLMQLEIVDRPFYGALSRGATALSELYGRIPYMDYSLLFKVVLRTIGGQPTDLARAVLRERMG